MNLGKGQDTIFEAVAKGHFFTPSAGENWDEEDVAKLRRAMERLMPGLVLAGLLPNVAGDWSLVAFIGGMLAISGAFRLWEENVWFKLGTLSIGLQTLCLCFQLMGQTMLPQLLQWAIYPVAGYIAMVAAALTPVLFTVGLWFYHRKDALFMGAAAAAAVALPLLKLAGDGLVMILVRGAVAAVGAGALLWLFIRAKQAPILPE